MLSLLPSRVLRLLEFIGFSGNRELGLSQLREGAAGSSIRAILCVLTLLFYHTYISDTWYVFGINNAGDYCNYFIKLLNCISGTGEGNLEEAEALLEPYLKKFPNGSIILFYDARVNILKGNFEQKFAVRKSRRYRCCQPCELTLPAFKGLLNCIFKEMMYVWNGFTIVDPSEYTADDQCLVQLLKGLCLKHLGRLLQLSFALISDTSIEKRVKYDHYLLPFTIYELGLLYKEQGDKDKAIRYIETAKTNYKDYSMESRLHFRIHAALSALKGSQPSTPSTPP
ncbi:hypothetical protein GDO86_001371 [Hymenochirus boettgeri]|uniref:Tetratricopeptide repeat protein 39B n=1 Tax=Hymenochirus boettgeri TaxID=247094 RepID=A0A8T2KFH6_9PIPI|nr:hypothetical protein GDO86_001371 [Hymenochirus boettgeri]